MSTDRSALAALQSKTKASLRYFELVELRFSGDSLVCYLCVGQHALYVVRRNLCGMFPDAEGGQIFYAHMERVVEDSASFSDLLIMMNENRPSAWTSEKLFVVSETRDRLVDQIKVAWQTDHTWRKGNVMSMPCTKFALRKKQTGRIRVLPFRKCKEIYFEGYSLFVNEDYEDKSGGMQSGVFRDEKREIELEVHATQQVPIAYLEEIGRGHIRWVAGEYKQNVTKPLRQVYVIKNQFYLKKMNLSNDVACWTGWELFIKSEQHAIITILLRRQYIPPILDTAQDVSVTIKCPMQVLNEGRTTDEALLQEARTAADSVSPLVQNCTVYPTLYHDMICAKADALLFDEDALRWLESLFDLKPKHQNEARRFMKSILKVLQDENALGSPDLIQDIDPPNALAMMQDPMLVVKNNMLKNVPGIPEEEMSDDNPVLNAWHARVSRYFAYCVDGGILGPAFTMNDLTSPFLITEGSQKKVREIITFLLHIRLKDMTKKYTLTNVDQLLHAPDFQAYSFNDRMMQSLLELGWIAQCLNKEDVGGKNTVAIPMTLEYTKFLGELLRGGTASASLKASICRQIISANQKQLFFSVLIPALMEIMNLASIYLKTYATVTLVNMTGGQERAKNMLMSMDVVPLLGEHLQSKDDDLIRYTLVLLANLTKSVHHRDVMKENGIVEILIDLLTGSYSNVFKRDILTELASVIGQLCNDEETRAGMCESKGVITCILYVFDKAPEGTKLKSKCMFALKQLCVNSEKNKERVGEQVTRSVVAELQLAESKTAEGRAHDVNLDCATNAILLLLLLAICTNNCKIMINKSQEPNGINIKDLIPKLLSNTKLGQMDSTRDRLNQLYSRVDEVTDQLAEDE